MDRSKPPPGIEAYKRKSDKMDEYWLFEREDDGYRFVGDTFEDANGQAWAWHDRVVAPALAEQRREIAKELRRQAEEEWNKCPDDRVFGDGGFVALRHAADVVERDDRKGE